MNKHDLRLGGSAIVCLISFMLLMIFGFSTNEKLMGLQIGLALTFLITAGFTLAWVPFGVEGQTERAQKNENAEETIISMINDIKQTEEGGCRDKMLALRYFCQDNPSAVANLIFSSLEERHKDAILFRYSLDHLGSCALEVQPFWSKMVREYILPRQNELSLEMKRQLKWWFKEKPNYNPEPKLPRIG